MFQEGKHAVEMKVGNDRHVNYASSKTIMNTCEILKPIFVNPIFAASKRHCSICIFDYHLAQTSYISLTTVFDTYSHISARTETLINSSSL